MKKENAVLKDEQGNEISSPRLSDNPSEEGEVKVSLQINGVILVTQHLTMGPDPSHLKSALHMFLLFNIHCVSLSPSRMMERRSPLPRRDKRNGPTKKTKRNREL